MGSDPYPVHSLYGPLVQPFRLALSQHPVWQFLENPAPVVLELFLIHYCALGVAMTEPVEGWIRRAGERCQVLGFVDIGAFLLSHAKEEKDHHVLFVKDTRWLVNRWNRRHDRQLDAERLLTRSPTPGVVNYRALHEATISGKTPYCQLAIEFEIERLSTTYGAAAIPKIVRVLGIEAIHGLQFLDQHVKHDLWYTALNEAHLNQLLRDMPSALSVLAETGGLALKAYGEYLTDCFHLASQLAVVCPSGEAPQRPLC